MFASNKFTIFVDGIPMVSMPGCCSGINFYTVIWHSAPDRITAWKRLICIDSGCYVFSCMHLSIVVLCVYYR